MFGIRTLTPRSSTACDSRSQGGGWRMRGLRTDRALCCLIAFTPREFPAKETRHLLPSRGAEETCQRSLRLLTWH